MAKVSERIEPISPRKLFVKGAQLQKTLLERVQQIEKLRTDLLQEITKQLREACGPDEDPVKSAAGLLIVLEDGYNLSAGARKVKSFLTRAAEMQRDHRELSLFGRNLMKDAVYEISWQEAELFGL